MHKLHDNQGSGLPPSDAPVWILGVCYKNGEGGGRATAAAEAAAEAAEDESNERVVVHKGAPSTSASASPPPPTTTTSGLDPEVAAAAASDWASIPWMTYRRGFPPIREDFDGDDDDGGGGGTIPPQLVTLRITLAHPKSDSFTLPPDPHSTFSGLMSPCTIRLAWR